MLGVFQLKLLLNYSQAIVHPTENNKGENVIIIYG